MTSCYLFYYYHYCYLFIIVLKLAVTCSRNNFTPEMRNSFNLYVTGTHMPSLRPPYSQHHQPKAECMKTNDLTEDIC